MHPTTFQSLTLAVIAAILFLIAASRAAGPDPGAALAPCEGQVCSEAGPDLDPDG